MPTPRTSAMRRCRNFRSRVRDGLGSARRADDDVTGLNQVHIEEITEASVPVASSIPYIGSAFKSVKEERNETALFVLVRPEILQSAGGDGASPTARHPDDVNVQR